MDKKRYAVRVNGSIEAVFSDKGRAITYCHQNGYPTVYIKEIIVESTENGNKKSE